MDEQRWQIELGNIIIFMAVTVTNRDLHMYRSKYCDVLYNIPVLLDLGYENFGKESGW